MCGRVETINLVDGKRFGVELVADPVAEFFVTWMEGIGDGIEQIVVARDAAAVFRWAGELAVRANGIGCVWLCG